MVWGMTLPASFGEFFPDGDFEYDAKSRESAWLERLRQHYLAQTPQEQLRLFDHRGEGVGFGAGEYPSYAWGKFTYGIGARAGPDSPAFVAAERHESPTSFDAEKSYAALGSMIMLNGRTLAVDDALKGIVDRREPGVHQFFPIEIRSRRGAMPTAKYFMLVIGRYLDSFSVEKSNVGAYRTYQGHPGFYNLENTKKGVTGLALDKNRFGAAHLWRERAFRETLTCFSDDLMAEISGAGLRVPNHYRMKAV